MGLPDRALSLVNYKSLISFPKCNIGFFGGTFNPPHYGHQAVVESALKEFLDYIVIAPHNHNPNKNQTVLKAASIVTFIAVRELFNATTYRSKIFMLDPDYLIGIQNDTFSKMSSDLVSRGITPHIVIADEAIKESYPEYMRHIPHIIAKRHGYIIDELLIKKIIGEKYHVLKTLDRNLLKLLQEGARNVPKYLDLFYWGTDKWKTGEPVCLKVGKAILKIQDRKILETNSESFSKIINEINMPTAAIKINDKVLELSKNQIIRTFLISDYTGYMIDLSDLDDYKDLPRGVKIDMQF